jgi:hypothetical protein
MNDQLAIVARHGRRLLLPAVVVDLLLGIAINIASAQGSTPSSDIEISVLEANPVLIAGDEHVTAGEGSNATPIPATSPSSAFSLDAGQTVARYLAMEELANQGANEAVAESRALVGQIYFDANGLPLACMRFDVDLRTLVSAESSRDNYLRGNALQTDSYQVAT